MEPNIYYKKIIPNNQWKTLAQTHETDVVTRTTVYLEDTYNKYWPMKSTEDRDKYSIRVYMIRHYTNIIIFFIK